MVRTKVSSFSKEAVCPILVPQGKSPLNGPKRDQFFSKQGPKRDQFLLKKGPFRPQTITTKSRLHYSKGVGEAGGVKALLFPAQSKKNINGKINEKTYL